MTDDNEVIEIPHSDATRVRLTVVYGVGDGQPVAVDVRLYRRIAGSGVFGATSAGMRYPRASLRSLADALTAMANRLEGGVHP